MNYEEIKEKINFAKKRYDDLCLLNDGDLPGANPSERQMLAQEFFVHLVGSIDYLFQRINEVEDLGLDKDDVTIFKILRKLDNKKPLYKELSSLYCNPKKEPNLINDGGYSFCNSEKGLIYRLWNYRHQVVHRGRQAFYITMPVGSTTSVKRGANLVLDPRSKPPVGSNRTVQTDLMEMLNLVNSKFEKIHKLINS
jgi:hypothetical protein